MSFDLMVMAVRYVVPEACEVFVRANRRLFIRKVCELSMDIRTHQDARETTFKAANFMYQTLPAVARKSVQDDVSFEVQHQMYSVFAAHMHRIALETALDDVAMYGLICRRLNKTYDVSHPTDIPFKYLATMAFNLDTYTRGQLQYKFGRELAEEEMCPLIPSASRHFDHESSDSDYDDVEDGAPEDDENPTEDESEGDSTPECYGAHL